MSLWWRSTAIGIVVVSNAVALGISLWSGFGGEDAISLLVGVIFVMVAGLLVLRVPENRVSWVLLVVAWAIALMGFGDVVSGIAIFVLLLPGLGVFLPLWFPTGRRPSPGWRWVEGLAVFGISGFFIGTLLLITSGVDVTADVGCDSVGGCISVAGLLALLVSIPASLASLSFRWRRAQVVERQQLKWFIFAFTIFGVGAWAAFGGFQYSVVANVVFPVGVALVPLSLVMAITRYRLFEIDRIISRTVGYGLLVGLLGAVYAAGAVWLPSRLTGDSPVFVAGSTLTVAALFNPLRRRVLRSIDRRFYRFRFDAERVIEDFSARLRDQTDLTTVTADLVAVVTKTLQTSSIEVWIEAYGASGTTR